jgi:hypothetical protein
MVQVKRALINDRIPKDQAAIKRASESVKKAEDGVESLKVSIGKAEAQIKASTVTVTKADAALAAAGAKFKASEQNKVAAEKQAAKRTKELHAADENIKKAAASRASLRKSVKTDATRVGKLHSTVRKLTLSKSSLKVSLAGTTVREMAARRAAKKTADELHGATKAAETAEADSKKSAAAAAKEAVKSLQSRLTTRNATLATVVAKLAALKKKLAGVKASLASASDLYNAAKLNHDKLTRSVEKADAALKGLHDARNSAASKLNSAHRDLKARQQSLAGTLKVRDHAQKARAAAVAALAKAKKDLVGRVAALKAKAGAIGATVAEKTKLAAVLAAHRGDVATWSAKIKAAVAASRRLSVESCHLLDNQFDKSKFTARMERDIRRAVRKIKEREKSAVQAELDRRNPFTLSPTEQKDLKVATSSSDKWRQKMYRMLNKRLAHEKSLEKREMSVLKKREARRHREESLEKSQLLHPATSSRERHSDTDDVITRHKRQKGAVADLRRDIANEKVLEKDLEKQKSSIEKQAARLTELKKRQARFDAWEVARKRRIAHIKDMFRKLATSVAQHIRHEYAFKAESTKIGWQNGMLKHHLDRLRHLAELRRKEEMLRKVMFEHRRREADLMKKAIDSAMTAAQRRSVEAKMDKAERQLKVWAAKLKRMEDEEASLDKELAGHEVRTSKRTSDKDAAGSAPKSEPKQEQASTPKPASKASKHDDKGAPKHALVAGESSSSDSDDGAAAEAAKELERDLDGIGGEANE